MATGIAAILCIDDELDVHDTATSALLAAIDRRTPLTRIGIGFGDLDAGDPIPVARHLCAIAHPGSILVADAVAAGVDRQRYPLVELGAVSFGGHADRWSVFELAAVVPRERSVVAIEAQLPGGFIARNVQREPDVCDRFVLEIARRHRGFVEDVRQARYMLAFDHPNDATRAAFALHAHDAERPAAFLVAVDRGPLDWIAGRWWGAPLVVAPFLASLGRAHIVLITAAVRAGLEPTLQQQFSYADGEELRVKGIGEPVVTFRARVT